MQTKQIFDGAIKFLFSPTSKQRNTREALAANFSPFLSKIKEQGQSVQTMAKFFEYSELIEELIKSVKVLQETYQMATRRYLDKLLSKINLKNSSEIIEILRADKKDAYLNEVNADLLQTLNSVKRNLYTAIYTAEKESSDVQAWAEALDNDLPLFIETIFHSKLLPTGFSIEKQAFLEKAFQKMPTTVEGFPGSKHKLYYKEWVTALMRTPDKIFKDNGGGFGVGGLYNKAGIEFPIADFEALRKVRAVEEKIIENSRQLVESTKLETISDLKVFLGIYNKASDREKAEILKAWLADKSRSLYSDFKQLFINCRNPEKEVIKNGNLLIADYYTYDLKKLREVAKLIEENAESLNELYSRYLNNYDEDIVTTLLKEIAGQLHYDRLSDTWNNRPITFSGPAEAYTTARIDALLADQG